MRARSHLPASLTRWHESGSASWSSSGVGFASGVLITNPRTAPRTPSRWCSFVMADSDFYRDYSRAVTWSAGFTLSGAGLEAQTGYHTGSGALLVRRGP